LSDKFPHLVPDAPLQDWEIRNQPRCGNCPFAEPDKDDGKLYCHEDSIKAQAVAVIVPPQHKTPVLTPSGAQVPPKPDVQVLGVISYWPEVQLDHSCWRHPAKQAARRALEHGFGC
jgi:hypothetical protein